jgi:hypothetical protein
VPILANLIKFKRRFPITFFRSYSFALVSLIITNGYFPLILVRKNGQNLSDLFFRSVFAMDLIIYTYNLKRLVLKGEEALQHKLDNILYTLADFFAKNITRHELIEDAVKDTIKNLEAELCEDSIKCLSAFKMKYIKSASIASLSSIIGDLLRGIIAVKHVDNVGLDYNHDETVIGHGIRINQFKEDDTFITFNEAYRWRSKYIEKIFD